jgi:hypothetical protein
MPVNCGGRCGKFSATLLTKFTFRAFSGMRSVASAPRRRSRATSFILIRCDASIQKLAGVVDELIATELFAEQLIRKYARASEQFALSLKSP